MNNAAVEKKLNLNIVILRSIACFGVVCLHSFGWFNSHVDHQLSYSIWYLFSFAIPVFFATSGYFVLKKNTISFDHVIRKIVSFILIVFTWCLLYSCLGIISHRIVNPVKTFVLAMLHKGPLEMLWFFGAMVILYALSPIFCRLMKNRKQCTALVIILLGANVVSHIINIWTIFNTDLSLYSYTLNSWFRQTYKIWTFALYFVMGGMLTNHDFKKYISEKISYRKALILSFVFLLLSVVYQQFVIGGIMTFNSPEYHHDSPVVILSVFMILCLFTCYREVYSCSTTVSLLSESLLGIYCLHGWVQKLVLRFFNISTLFNIGLYVIATFIISFLLWFIMRRIPVIRLLVALQDINFLDKLDRKKSEAGK